MFSKPWISPTGGKFKQVEFEDIEPQNVRNTQILSNFFGEYNISSVITTDLQSQNIYETLGYVLRTSVSYNLYMLVWTFNNPMMRLSQERVK